MNTLKEMVAIHDQVKTSIKKKQHELNEKKSLNTQERITTEGIEDERIKKVQRKRILQLESEKLDLERYLTNLKKIEFHLAEIIKEEKAKLKITSLR